MARSFPDSFWAVVSELNGSVLWCDEEGSQVHILLPELRGAEQRLDGVLGPPIWRVQRAHRSELAYRDRRLHLLDRLEWRGMELADTAAIRASGILGLHGVPVAPVTEAAPPLWLFRLLIGADVPEKIRAAVVEAVRVREEGTFALLVNATGRRWATRLMSLARSGSPPQPSFIRALRRAMLWRGMRHPRATLVGCSLELRTEIALWRRPPVGWVALIGPDGTGKSTVQAGVQSKLSREFSGSIAVHWRPGVLLRSELGDTEAVRQPHAAALRGRFVSVLKLAFLALDWGCGNLLLIRPARAAGRLVVFDRHFVDILVDPRRYRYGGPAWLTALVARLVPSPDLWIVLDGSPEIIRARKDEVGAEDLARLRLGYLRLAARLENAEVVDVAGALDEVVDRVAELVLDMISRRTERESRPPPRTGQEYRSA
ncbi:MAG: thymidylate kinase [Rhodospirillales bacterium]|nr:thymidylate kinase [Rhodospirillales bacterium]